ncbi:MAG TPA: acyltransferase domain-containing protein [Actinocrinis sp.]|uniref:acyltransferase domain-containing protein n=1 Tax=Actinocrinis sp. TaxID=1920516 RepID=UPI002D241BDB|nr:acyltransferase domain-containing protein [Actinocrinis sp.]HZU56478.1 acyltransferase domain-containing protein [Actinocrinis sp.]
MSARIDPGPRIAFAFTGQGAQYPGMTARLYLGHDGYRRHLDAAAEALRPYTGTCVTDLIVRGDLRVHQTGFTQPSMFAVEYALAATLQDAGVRPVAVIGHSIGEFAAAVIAGALNLEDAALLVAVRGAYMQYLPSGGGMLAVRAAPEELEEFVAGEPRVGFGAFNGPKATVLSGDLTVLERIHDELTRRRILGRLLQVSHGFHSPLMQPMLQRFARVASRVLPRAPKLPFYSTVRGRRLLNEALGALYWTEHISAPVRFAQAAQRLLAEQRLDTVLEIGPKPVLTNLIKALAGENGPACVPACRSEDTDAAALTALITDLLPDDAMDRDPVQEAVYAAVAQLVDDPSVRIGPDVALRGDLGFDSVMVMQLTYQLEQRLPALGKLSLPDMLDSIVTPATLAEYLRGQLSAGLVA